MIYKNAKDILPSDLLEKIQEHIHGTAIYIPSPEPARKSWGIKNGTRKKYDERNTEIKNKKTNGRTVTELADEYYLSADTIKKILR